MHAPKGSRRQTGFTLVELMVGLVVGLLVGLAAAGSAMFFMASQRQAVSVGGVQGEAANALAAVKHELSQAGLGFYANGNLMCQQINVSVGNAALMEGAAVNPLLITATADSVVIDSMYSTSLDASAPAQLQNAAALSDGAVRLASYLPVSTGQAVVLMSERPGDLPCTLRTVTTVEAATADTAQRLVFASAGAHNHGAFGNLNYPEKSVVAHFGDLNWSRFVLEGTNLVMERPLQGTRAVLARHVIAFSAQYGLVDEATRSLQEWRSVAEGDAPLDNATLRRLVALRVGVVVRAPQREKADPQGVCSATEDRPELFGTAVNLEDPQWRCHRYRQTTLVVPLRNVLLGRGA